MTWPYKAALTASALFLALAVLVRVGFTGAPAPTATADDRPAEPTVPVVNTIADAPPPNLVARRPPTIDVPTVLAPPPTEPATVEQKTEPLTTDGLAANRPARVDDAAVPAPVDPTADPLAPSTVAWLADPAGDALNLDTATPADTPKLGSDDARVLVIGRQPAADGPVEPLDPIALTDRPAADPPAPPTGVQEIVVGPGDTMTSLAVRVYGDANAWVRLAQANPLVDPQKLRVGQRLRLPAGDNAPPTESPAETGLPADAVATETPELEPAVAHVIRAGDSLSTIAQRYYGDSTLWRRIFDANRDAIGDNPNRLKLGTTLVIPPPQ